jgi:putative restriction endonuclease
MLNGDLATRSRIFELLEEHRDFGNGTITRAELEKFSIDGETLKMIDQSRGIRNLAEWDETLSIISNPDGPYPDKEVMPGIWEYHYQKGTTDGSNAKLRRAMETQTPIILLRMIAKGVFVPVFPVYVIKDDIERRIFTVAVTDNIGINMPDQLDNRAYREATAKRRVHQPEFRARVLRAYDEECALCRLKYVQLLDAAHILPDSHPQGFATVHNGLSLCKIHHAAYDSDLMGIDTNYKVHINQRLLEDSDGPMLKHGLQEMHGTHLTLPHDSELRPARENLAERFEKFSAAS